MTATSTREITMTNIDQMNEEELRAALHKTVELLEQAHNLSVKYRTKVKEYTEAVGRITDDCPWCSGQMGAIK